MKKKPIADAIFSQIECPGPQQIASNHNLEGTQFPTDVPDNVVDQRERKGKRANENETEGHTDQPRKKKPYFSDDAYSFICVL